MRVLGSPTPLALLLAAGAFAQAASTWSFKEASVSVGAKNSDRSPTSFGPESPVPTALALGSGMSVKIQLTTMQGKGPKRPHEAFLLLRDADSGLEAPFPLKMKESGKASLEIAHQDVPTRFLTLDKPLSASLLLASAGASAPVSVPLFEIALEQGVNAAAPPVATTASRFESQASIQNTFPLPDKTPPSAVSLLFLGAVAVALPTMVFAWLNQGANAGSLGNALGAAPISHATFLGSVVAMEVVFFMYYSGWNLFQTLPVIGAVGTVTFMSGMQALGEVQTRRRVAG